MLLLRNSISNSFKFFHKSLQTLRSLFSCSDMTHFHKISNSSPNFQNSCNPEISMNAQTSSCSYQRVENPRKVPVPSYREKGKREEAGERQGSHSLLVAEKLKELEKMDKSNVDHVLDIEEVLHYYNRLNCPVYLDIFHNFFTQMYSELVTPSTTCSGPNRVRATRPKYRKMRHRP